MSATAEAPSAVVAGEGHTGEPPPRSPTTPVTTHVRAFVCGGVPVALMLVWAVADGGFDPGTWYWGALVMLGALAATALVGRYRQAPLPRPLVAAVALFAAYVAWSYASIAWADYPGDALQGANRALLYLLVFWAMAIVPWTRVALSWLAIAFAVGVGVIALVLQFRFALGTDVAGLFIDGRLGSPTGYINSTAALFTLGALTATALAVRRSLSGPLRGLLLACACADLQLAVTVQSRGWLFTLPLVALAAIVLVKDRLRTAMAAVLPVAGTFAVVGRLLHVYQLSDTAALQHAATRAGSASLLGCAAVFAAGTLMAWTERVRARPPLDAVRRRALGTGLVLVALGAIAAGLVVVSHGHPASFVAHQWNGFSDDHEPTSSSTHFVDVGSGRLDIWRSAWHAFESHPIGGLGQDNFADYYLTHRHTGEEPQWTHSLEMRLLAHTGAVGFVLFAAFMAAALTAALRARRRGAPADRLLVGVLLMPLVVWLIHGSIDWFWEVPALTGPALGFLAAAGALSAGVVRTDQGSGVYEASRARDTRRRIRISRPLTAAAGAAAFVAALIVLALPYLATVELSRGEAASGFDARTALADFNRSHRLNPLSSDPGVLGGTVALQQRHYADAHRLFAQATTREPGNWFAWLGAGLAASSRGDRTSARRDLHRALTIDDTQYVVTNAVARMREGRPLTVREALSEINFLP